MDAFFASLLHWFSLPEWGLPTVFVTAFVSATWLPMGSEAALMGLIAISPHLFWPALLLATVGNTLGGMVSWLMGAGLQSAHRAYQNRAHPHRRADAQATPTAGRLAAWALAQLEKLGPKACLLAWLPVVGDVVCTLAGWLRMPWLACAVYMAIGKFARYLATAASAQWLMS